MNIDLDTIVKVMEIAGPIVGVIAWFVRLEYKQTDHEGRITSVEENQTGFNALVQQISNDLTEIKTNMKWIIKLSDNEEAKK